MRMGHPTPWEEPDFPRGPGFPEIDEIIMMSSDEESSLGGSDRDPVEGEYGFPMEEGYEGTRPLKYFVLKFSFCSKASLQIIVKHDQASLLPGDNDEDADGEDLDDPLVVKEREHEMMSKNLSSNCICPIFVLCFGQNGHFAH